jgi:hypothetical protein
MPEPRDPVTPNEWQEAVDMAEFLLLMESAKMYGLVSFETVIHPKRCCHILALGMKHGYQPKSESELVKKFLVPA